MVVVVVNGMGTRENGKSDAVPFIPFKGSNSPVQCHVWRAMDCGLSLDCALRQDTHFRTAVKMM